MKIVLLACSALALLAVLLSGSPAVGQAATLTPGTVPTTSVHSTTCPTDFWAGGANPPACFTATVNCSNAATTPSLSFTFSYVTPSAAPFGTIVLFSGAGGRVGSLEQVNNHFAQDYYNANYQVVEIAWDTDWEQTTDPLGILTAGCRPAGFLSYLLTNPAINLRSPQNPKFNPTYGLCAQGISAGSGAIAYSIAWYLDGPGGGPLSADYDNVELESGPVFSDIMLGCQGPTPSIVPICYPGQQYGCSPGTTGWGNIPSYSSQNAPSVQSWTGSLSPACGAGNTTASNPKWKAMSIVTGTGGSFAYPKLGLAGWLCTSSNPGGCDPQHSCPNNSAAEGEIFYNQFTSSSQAVGYELTGILNCEGPEGVSSGTDPDPYPPGCTPGVNCTNQGGRTAIEAHMVKQCKHSTN